MARKWNGMVGPSSPAVGVDTRVGSAVLSVDLYIGNHAHIQAAYGSVVAAEVVDALEDYIREKAAGAVLIARSPSGGVHIDVLQPCLAQRARPEILRWLSLDIIGANAPCITVSTSQGHVSLWLSAMVSGLSGGEVDQSGAAMSMVSFAGEPVFHNAAWAARYRADMAAAVSTMGLLTASAADPVDTEALVLHWQPIRNAWQPDRVLYSEGLARLKARSGEARSAGAEVAALERTGFVRVLDHHIVSLVISELARTPDIALAANISAQSLCWDRRWADIKARLRMAPALARRLVIEITETAAIADMSAAVSFVSHMRAVGCRIALDDFGAGHTSVHCLQILSPDIVKIDRMFLVRAMTSNKERQSLFHLAQLAGASGASVVIEGVEDQAQCTLASKIGIEWQQGYHWGVPKISNDSVSGHLVLQGRHTTNRTNSTDLRFRTMPF